MISVTALQQNSKTIYVGLLSTLTVFLLMDYICLLYTSDAADEL